MARSRYALCRLARDNVYPAKDAARLWPPSRRCARADRRSPRPERPAARRCDALAAKGTTTSPSSCDEPQPHDKATLDDWGQHGLLTNTRLHADPPVTRLVPRPDHRTRIPRTGLAGTYRARRLLAYSPVAIAGSLTGHAPARVQHRRTVRQRLGTTEGGPAAELAFVCSGRGLTAARPDGGAARRPALRREGTALPSQIVNGSRSMVTTIATTASTRTELSGVGRTALVSVTRERVAAQAVAPTRNPENDTGLGFLH